MGLDNPSYVVDFDASSGIAHWVHYACPRRKPKEPCLARMRFVRIPGCLQAQTRRRTRAQVRPRPPQARGGFVISSEEMRASFDDQHGSPDTQLESRNLKGLEEAVRAWALIYGEVHVTCGPGGETYDVLASGVRVPTTFWKAVMRTSPDTACVAFVFPNADKVPVNSRIIWSPWMPWNWPSVWTCIRGCLTRLRDAEGGGHVVRVDGCRAPRI